MQKSSIEKLVDETINSLNGAVRAEAKPFLLTRIYARMQNEAGLQNIWTRAAAFLTTPRVALAGLLLIVILNVTIIMQRSAGPANTVQNSTSAKDEFAINVVSIYDVENQEP
jgi:hypothetical protein